MKKFLIFTLLCGAVFAFAGKVTVVLPNSASVTEKTAAQELQVLLKKVSQISLVKEGTKTSGKVIYVGNTAFAKKNNAVRKFDTEEWLIQAVDANTLILNGGQTCSL